MGDKGIIFSAPMVRALIEGRKTQTRRVLNPYPFNPELRPLMDGYKPPPLRLWQVGPRGPFFVLPYAPGDRLWVKEALIVKSNDQSIRWAGYEADGKEVFYLHEWMWKRDRLQAMFCPRWASRLTLTVTDVRVQRLQEISAEDAIAEGIERHGANYTGYGRDRDLWMLPRPSYASLWNSLHGPDAWEANPWVAAITFTVRKGNIDAA